MTTSQMRKPGFNSWLWHLIPTAHLGRPWEVAIMAQLIGTLAPTKQTRMGVLALSLSVIPYHPVSTKNCLKNKNQPKIETNMSYKEDGWMAKWAHEKMFSIISHEANANKPSEVHRHPPSTMAQTELTKHTAQERRMNGTPIRHLQGYKTVPLLQKCLAVL